MKRDLSAPSTFVESPPRHLSEQRLLVAHNNQVPSCSDAGPGSPPDHAIKPTEFSLPRFFHLPPTLKRSSTNTSASHRRRECSRKSLSTTRYVIMLSRARVAFTSPCSESLTERAGHFTGDNRPAARNAAQLFVSATCFQLKDATSTATAVWEQVKVRTHCSRFAEVSGVTVSVGGKASLSV